MFVYFISPDSPWQCPTTAGKAEPYTGSTRHQASSTEGLHSMLWNLFFFQTCLVSMSGVNMIMYKHTHRNMLQLLAQVIAQSVTTILCALVYNSFLLSHHRWYEKEPPGLLLQRKITTKRVLRSASKPSSEPESSSDEDAMQEERRVSVNTSSTDIAFG
jgi:hypothetical protein